MRKSVRTSMKIIPSQLLNSNSSIFFTTTNTEEDKSMNALHHNLGHAPIELFF